MASLGSFLEPKEQSQFRPWKPIDPKVVRRFDFSSEPEQMKVFLRLKPLAKDESGEGVYVIKDQASLVMHTPPQPGGQKDQPPAVVYSFTKIFGPGSTQVEVFRETTLGFISDLFNGRSSLIFTYGTTGSGKTFTIQGTGEKPGLIPEALALIFRQVSNCLDGKSGRYCPIGSDSALKLSLEAASRLECAKQEMLASSRSISKLMGSADSTIVMESLNEELTSRVECDSSLIRSDDQYVYSVWVSFVEIYNEHIFDMLQDITSLPPRSLRLVSQKKSCYVKDLRYINVESSAEAFGVFLYGQNNLRVSATMLNKFSSRSHSIFTIKLVKRRLSDNKIEITSFTLCDLAGVERHKKMENVAQHLRETQNINTSHLVLNRCFRIIRENQKSGEKSHVPFRDSKLTQILQRALTGTDKMAMIVNISQCLKLVQETQHVLRTSAEAHKIESVYKPPQRRKSRFLTAYNECRIPDFGKPAPPRMPVSSPTMSDPELTIKLQEQEDTIAALRSELRQVERKVRVELSEAYSEIIDEIKAEHKKRLEAAIQKAEASVRMEVGTKRRRMLDCSISEDSFMVQSKERSMVFEMSLAKGLAEKEKTISNLRKMNSDLKFQLTNTMEDAQILRKNYDALVEGMDSGDLKEAINSLQQALDTKANRLKKCEELVEFAHEEFNSMTRKINQLEDEIQNNQELLGNKDLEIEELKSTIQTLEQEFSMRESRTMLKKEVEEEKVQEEEVLKEHVDEDCVDEELNEVDLNVRMMNVTLEESDIGRTEADESVSVSQEVNKLVENELKDKVASLEAGIDELHQKLKAKCDEAIVLEDKYRKLCEEYEAVKNEKEEAIRSLDNKVKELTGPENSVCVSQEVNRLVENELKDKVISLEAGIDELQQKLKAKCDEAFVWEDKYRKLSEQYEVVKNEKEEPIRLLDNEVKESMHNSINDQTHEEIRHLKETVDSLTTELKVKTKELEETVDKLTGELAAKTKELEDESVKHKSDVAVFNNENSSLKCRLKILESNIKLLESAHVPVQRTRSSLSSPNLVCDDDDDDYLFTIPKARTAVKSRRRKKKEPEEVPSYTLKEPEEKKEEEEKEEKTRRSRRTGRKLFSQETCDDEKLLDISLHGMSQSSPSTTIRVLRSTKKK